VKKQQNTGLDVDFIGGQAPLTRHEELAISAFIKAQKEKRLQQAARKAKTKP
jgi:hypothetical protein